MALPRRWWLSITSLQDAVAFILILILLCPSGLLQIAGKGLMMQTPEQNKGSKDILNLF